MSTEVPNLDGYYTAYEKVLLRRSPIIAPDGYIPNSVVRKKLNFVKPIQTRLEDLIAWKPKPIPKPDPKHVPEGWDFKPSSAEASSAGGASPFLWCDDDEKEERAVEAGSPVSAGLSRESPDKSNVASLLRSKLKYKPMKQYELKSNLAGGAIKQEQAAYPLALKKKGKVRSLKTTTDKDLKTSVVDHQDEEAISGTSSESLQESESEDAEEAEERKRKRCQMEVDRDLLRRLLENDWFELPHDIDELTVKLDDLLERLYNIMHGCVGEVHKQVCEYLVEIKQYHGMPDEYSEKFVDLLTDQLSHDDPQIRVNCVKTMPVIGDDKRKALHTILPFLLDEDAAVKDEAVNAVYDLTGFQDKDNLLLLFDEIGITQKVDNREVEKILLDTLAEKLGISDIAGSLSRISQWVVESIPGVFEDDAAAQAQQKEKRSDSIPFSKEESSVSQKRKESIDKARRVTKMTKESSALSSDERKQSVTPTSPHVDKVKQEEGVAAQGGMASRNSTFDPRSPAFYGYYERRNSECDGNVRGLQKSPVKKLHGISDTDEGDYEESSQSDIVSTYDSGIGRDLSETSSMRVGPSLKTRGRPTLSPVKSMTEVEQKMKEEWKAFFDTPTARERKQLEMVKKDFTEGKMKQKVSTLPPISYIPIGHDFRPGESGLRLLHSVHIGDKKGEVVERHRIEAVPGKLSVHTKNKAQGLTNFGLLKMQWTTGIPCITGPSETHPPADAAAAMREARNRIMESELYFPQIRSLSDLKHLCSPQRVKYSGDYTLLPCIEQQNSKYEWDDPLPPAPARESRIAVPHVRRTHERYCKYYELVKKRMHLYTNQKLQEKPMPETVATVKPEIEHEVEKSSPDPSDEDEGIVLTDDIKIGQLLRTGL